MSEPVRLSLEQLSDLVARVLRRHGLSAAHAQSNARVIVAGERDECRSHGLYRVLTAVATLREGRVARDAAPRVRDSSGAGTVLIDAQDAFSALAFETARPLLAARARALGIAALGIRRCFHYTALWPEVEALAEDGLACIAMTVSRAWVAPSGGRRPVLGTNPFAFAWPRSGQLPYVFDFATSVAARGDIELHRRRGAPLPEGWGVDGAGEPSRDARTVLDDGAMLAFGGHKGSALSTMIELLAGPLIGELTSLDALALGSSPASAPQHGELLIAFDPSRFGSTDPAADAARAERLFAAFADAGARLPSQRRFAARARSIAHGVEVDADLYRDVLKLLD